MPSTRLHNPLSTLELFARIRGLRAPALLHSSDPQHAASRYDILVADPLHTVTYSRGLLSIGDRRFATADPLRTLGENLPRSSYHPSFRFGFVGAFGYDLGRRESHQAARPADPTGLPDLVGGIYSWSIVVDRGSGETRLWWQEGTDESMLDGLHNRLSRPPAPAEPWCISSPFESEMSDLDYAAAFDRVMAYLHAGDCYQVNLARHFSAAIDGNAADAGWAIYQALCRVQPGPFGAYLETAWGNLLSVSPERLLRVEPDRALTMPIKGTSPRRDATVADAASRLHLAESAKDRAENLMIVDLMRNDLGRFCRPGSIDVPRLFEVQSFANVHHLVSTVEGRPMPGIGALEALSAVLPAGSVTGCPKLRATEIIDELEPVGRSMYCGAIGYLDTGGLLDCNVAIRTLVLAGDRIHCWGGGGIVADSVCESEAREIDHKIGRLLQAIGAFPSSSAFKAS